MKFRKPVLPLVPILLALVGFTSFVGSAVDLSAQVRARVQIATGDYAPAPLNRDAEVQPGTTVEVGRGIVVLQYQSHCGDAVYVIIRESVYTTQAELDCSTLRVGEGDELRRAMAGGSMADQFVFYSPPDSRCERPPCYSGSSGEEDILAALEDLRMNPMPTTGAAIGGTLGPFEVIAVHSGRCMGVPGASLESGPQLVQWGCNGSPDQRWYLRPASGGAYEVVNMNSGKCMDVSGASSTDAAAILQYDCHGQSNQLWDVRMVDGTPLQGHPGSGHYQFVARHSGSCIDVAQISTDDGAIFHQVGCLGPQQRNQLFFLRP